MARVDLKGVDKSFGAAPALAGIDLDIPDGEFTVVVGPSGCGKSTLLRIIAGLEQPTSGDVLIDGASALSDTPAQRGVAMVFQSYALYPHLNVFDNMAFGLRMARTPEAEVKAAVRRAAGMLGIESLLDRRPKALSGGQRQRVAIGRAIVRQPRLFLLDEPLSNLDAGLRVHMRHEFARLHRELKTTMVYVTHDQVEAMTLADRIVVLNGGRIEQSGTPAQIYHSPKNLFVASFLGSPRMNLIPGEVTGGDADRVAIRLASGAEVKAAAAPMPAGAQVTLGVRPDALKRGEGGNSLSAAVDVVENLGAAQTVYTLAEAGVGPLCAVLPGGEALRHDDRITLTFAPEDAYLFDADGVAVARGQRSPNLLSPLSKVPSPLLRGEG